MEKSIKAILPQANIEVKHEIDGEIWKELPDEVKQVICYIPKGRENAISRGTLVELMGMPDTIVRQLVAQARKAGAFICNTQNGKGYFIAGTDVDLLRQYAQDTARALSILERRKEMRKYLKARGYKLK